ncbi:hypothetical protein Y032_0018g3610 [Ancylostoma ceylanicum]|uniref:Uncharacterized protein n=1 Tax=Ancylostoma ceylanicum TaxID=53326 RepID=A0A016V388_9BILA|nr:hypothetical protein Y032_0018g3610 [Ancylostoma ceylanicum]
MFVSGEYSIEDKDSSGSPMESDLDLLWRQGETDPYQNTQIGSRSCDESDHGCSPAEVDRQGTKTQSVSTTCSDAVWHGPLR